ncbi:uncharacterized protein BXIN_2693 [Babesia sp. Xinjiang]|uniref:uncharacterized protein n=1 Tax=Babesia sp. Xinjiang TaxID=462227 RepID=UPI000A22C53E|nr:uncharacterized protein BXIN_2627 [Babesia sp. Xinjiang]XP_028872106.1 uncharacterized protein BXIN_2693 [Babesia sp. Xinjiang]ORM41590.1 hypothetical protein BXIN_2627 [Babesia sp. Xinjiang]ORM41650.1 hypothetical protein BXIN_2693 [Babesia sp. Xinjiang]
MTNDIYRRNINRSESSPRDEYVGDNSQGYQYHGSQSGRSHHSQSISLKAIKNTSLSCAKSLTNKIISMSNSGIQAASSAINTYKENAAANARKAAMANPNSFLRISERISNSGDPIASHRELVAVIEHILTWSGQPAQMILERDRFGQPTNESMSKIRLINDYLLEKVISYVQGRRDCCLFIVKFATWRMRTTHQPEEIILSLELLEHCMECFGGFFLSLMTKSCMRRFKRLLKMSKITTSIAGGVKKQLTKLLVGSSNVHPGVPSDVRIHVIKAKIRYMVQLWHDVFLLDQGLFPVFFQGYRDLRECGIKFPQIDPAEHKKINLSPVVPKTKFTVAGGVTLPLSPEEFDSILSTVQSLTDMPSGAEHVAALKRLNDSKKRIVASINILAESRAQVADMHNYEDVMRKLLMLNDCIGAHLQVGGDAAVANAKLRNVLEHVRMETSRRSSSSNTAAPGEPAKANLLDLDSSSESDNDDFNDFFGNDKSGNTKKTDDDYDKFFADFGVFTNSTSSSAPAKTERVESSRSDRGNDYVSDLESLNFDNPIATPSSNISISAAALSSERSNTHQTLSDATSSSSIDCFKRSTGSAVDASVSRQNNPSGAQPQAYSSSKEGEEGKKNLNEMVNELDNIDTDFRHMSVTSGNVKMENAHDTAYTSISPEDCIRDGRCPLRSLWTQIMEGINRENFDHWSFVGGVCFGTGISIILTRALRGIFLVATGGLVTTMLLSHYGLISINREAMSTTLQNGAQAVREKLELFFQNYGGQVQLLSENVLKGKIPRNRIISAMIGTGIGFGVGLIVF